VITQTVFEALFTVTRPVGVEPAYLAETLIESVSDCSWPRVTLPAESRRAVFADSFTTVRTVVPDVEPSRTVLPG